MTMEVDTLDYAIGDVLECDDRQSRPVVFLQKSLNKTKRNYEIHNKEMIRGLEN